MATQFPAKLIITVTICCLEAHMNNKIYLYKATYLNTKATICSSEKYGGIATARIIGQLDQIKCRGQ